jgi:hypothetical protein
MLNSSLPISVSYSFGVNRILAENKSTENMWSSNGGILSVSIPKQLFNKIVILRLEFKQQNPSIFLNIKGLNVPAEDPNDSGIRCKYGNDSPNPNYTGLIVGMVAGIIFAGVLYAVFVHYRDKSKETNPSEIYLLQQNIADTRS